jgi:ABC-type transport system involved in multi-copper enzyme maturation permease subunit
MTIDSVVAQTSLRQEAQDNPVGNLWTLTRVNLYLAWRRAMSKVLLLILLGLFGLIIGLIVIAYNAEVGAPLSAFSECPRGATNCPQISDAQLEQVKEQRLAAIRETVTFPSSLGLVGGYTGFVGALLIAILAGTLIGSEYGLGTLRLSLTRGLGRVQVLAGQVIAIAALALVASVGMLLVGVLVGVTIGPAIGGTIPNVTAEGARELIVYGLALSLQLFVYALIALGFATLGRSAAAGIGGAIGLLFLEFVATNIVFPIVGALVAGDWGERITHIPDWFPANNIGALTAHAGEAPISLTQVSSSTLDLTHAALVVAVYVVVLIGGSYALFRLRDVTD